MSWEKAALKVLHVNEFWGPFGGTEQDLFNLCRGLNALGCTNVVAYGRRTGVWQSDCAVAEEEIPGWSSNSAWTNAAKLVASHQPDVILLHNVSDTHLIEALGSLRPTARKIHDHRLYCLRRSRMLLGEKACARSLDWGCVLRGCVFARSERSRLVPTFNSLARRKAELRSVAALPLLIVATNHMKGELRRNGVPSDRIEVVPLGIDLSGLVRKALPDHNTLLYVGQIERAKGLHHLIQAFGSLELDDAKLLIVGKGGFEERCRRLVVSLGLEGSVRFLGWVSQAKVREVYDESKLVAVPSIWPEPFGLVGIEAMAHGRPVVAYDTGGISDWLRHEYSGLLVPAGDIRALSGAIQSILSDPCRAAELGANARRIAETEYSLASYARRMLVTLERLTR